MSGPLVRLSAAVEEAALATWRRRGQALVTVFAAGVSLTFPLLLLLSLGWVDGLFLRLADQERTRVFLTRDASPGDVAALLDTLGGREGVSDLELVQPDQARLRFLQRYPELAPVADGLGPDDLRFPAGVEFRPPPETEAAASLAAELARLPGVDDVRHDAAWALALQRLHRTTAGLRALVALLALAVAGFAIGNVVALGALSRREELSVMRLVGAPRFHVRAPFWIVGFAEGLAGGALAAALTRLLSGLGAPRLAGVLPTAVAGPSGGELLLVVLAAAMAGLCGAAVSVEAVLRRHARLER
jgi:cell division transport system permease protein